MDEETLRKLRESSGLWLDAEGDFWQADGRVEHARTREVLHRGVHRAADGRWAVRVGREWAYLEVRDAAFFVRDLLIDEARATAQGTLTSGEQHEFDLHTITLGARDALYLRRADGERVRLTRAAQLSLMERVAETPQCFVLRVGEHEIAIGRDAGPEPVRTPHP